MDSTVPRDRPSHITWLAVFLVLLLVPFLIDFDPAQGSSLSLFGRSLPSACPSQRYLDFECPGCGLTRSFVAIAHGEWEFSFAYHRVGILLYIFFALRVPVHAWLLSRPHAAGRPALVKAYNGSAWCMITLLLLNWGVGLYTGSNGGW
jgi:hypothetical protein